MDEIIHDAFDRILARDFHPRRSSFADRVVVLVVSAQGLVDNGGFAYFHGLPFDPPADPEDFERVYAAIGADACADAFREALARHRRGGEIDWSDLDDVVVSASDEVYGRLSAWIAEHGSELA